MGFLLTLVLILKVFEVYKESALIKCKAEGCSLAHRRFIPNGAAMSFDDSLYGAKPNASALVLITCV